jgi:hypothetical protein
MTNDNAHREEPANDMGMTTKTRRVATNDREGTMNNDAGKTTNNNAGTMQTGDTTNDEANSNMYQGTMYDAPLWLQLRDHGAFLSFFHYLVSFY